MIVEQHSICTITSQGGGPAQQQSVSCTTRIVIVGGLLPVQVILYFAQHTEAEGGFQEVNIFGTLAGLNLVEQKLQVLLLCRSIEDKNLEES